MRDSYKRSAMDSQYTKNIFLGVMIGGLAGVATVFLFAAQSAKLARAKIRRQGAQWMDRAAGGAGHSPVRGGSAAGGRTAGNMTVQVS